MRTMTTQVCIGCQKEFDAVAAEANRGNAKFCSRSCSRKQPRKTPEPNVECGYCHAPLYRTASRIANNNSGVFFCNKQHQILGYADPNVPVQSGPKATIDNPCIDCGKQTTVERCQSCLRQYKIDQWLSGNNEITWYGQNHDTAKWVKEYIVHIRGDACEVCGFNELHPFYHTSIIQMDHIDGNSLNNDPSNLKLLCPNHHTMTITYGSRNKNSGRHSRRMASIKASMIDS